MKNKETKTNKKTLAISGICIAFFLALMIYALRQDPSFTPSQLVGEKAPEINASFNTGDSFNSNSIFAKNNWVVLNFWSSFCVVCRSEAPEIEKFYQTIKSNNFTNTQFFSVNIQDDKQTINQWQKSYGQTFPVIQDLKGLISVRYGVTGTPETFFINPQGVVKYRIAGGVSKDFIFKFIDWFDKNPNATQQEATQALIKIRSDS